MAKEYFLMNGREFRLISGKYAKLWKRAWGPLTWFSSIFVIMQPSLIQKLSNLVMHINTLPTLLRCICRWVHKILIFVLFQQLRMESANPQSKHMHCTNNKFSYSQLFNYLTWFCFWDLQVWHDSQVYDILIKLL